MNMLTRRHVMAGAAAAMAVVAVSGCSITIGNPIANPPGPCQPQDDYRVAYIARAQVDSFAAWLANEMKDEAAQYPDISLNVFDGQADDEVENRMIENAIANKYDAIIVQANNGEAQRPYIEASAKRGIVTITTNPKVENIEGASSVDSNPYDQGAVVAREALDQIPPNAKVVVLDGPGGNYHSMQRRQAWQTEFFDKRPDVTVVSENIANWNKDEALRLMEDWSLANPQIDAIVSMNDNMATGALEAVKGKPAFKNILSYGVDGTPEAAMLVENGGMTATALQNATELAELNMKSVHELLSCEKDSLDVTIGNPLITKDNAGEFVDMYRKAGLVEN
ncbi:sugar ABC transporter substrate-binding protein [Rhodococcus opacus]|uniref:sugar ABC transporter substrate-binding protein n=1 Tax=Rhodococcus opacus TaxID=37919 RepID=UPI0022356C2F|nr:sugar ABC transporter substrate-binding protein [Rhodococcus opacus]UZG60171.1 sugar ABC transporter substrate-binding protein [Rhodococcus opacus]